MVLDYKFTVNLGDGAAQVDCKIYEDNAAHAHFYYFRKDYNFTLRRWKSTAFAQFRSLFHRVYDDSDKFGSSEVDPDTGDVISSTNTSDQNKNVVKQAINDVFRLLHFILKEYPREVIDYAVWFCDKHSSRADTEYSAYIHVLTCRCIIDGEFMAGNVARRVVYYPFCSDDT